MSSFTITVIDSITNAEGLTPGSSISSGQELVLCWGAGTSFGGNPTAPTSVTDNNGNVYSQVSASASGQPPQGTTAVYLCIDPVLTPHNPPTITCSGATGVPSGGPSIILLGITPPSAYDIYAANFSGSTISISGNSMSFNVGTVAGVGTDTLTFSLTCVEDTTPVGCQSGILFIKRGSDVLALLCGYYNGSDVVTWTTTGTSVVSYTQETQSGTSGRSFAVASYAVNMTDEACGYVAAAITVFCNNPPGGTVGIPYAGVTFTATGGTSPYTFSITAGALPPGLTMTSGGTVSGTPTTAGTYPFTVTATDADSDTGSVNCSITIVAGLTALCNDPPNGTVGVAYSHQFGAAGGTPPYTFMVVPGLGILPPGITMNSAGLASGTPTTPGSYTFTLQVTDSVGSTSRVTCTIVIGSPTPGPTDTQFFLTHVVLGLKQSRVPVRGSAT